MNALQQTAAECGSSTNRIATHRLILNKISSRNSTISIFTDKICSFPHCFLRLCSLQHFQTKTFKCARFFLLLKQYGFQCMSVSLTLRVAFNFTAAHFHSSLVNSFLDFLSSFHSFFLFLAALAFRNLPYSILLY